MVFFSLLHFRSLCIFVDIARIVLDEVSNAKNRPLSLVCHWNPLNVCAEHCTSSTFTDDTYLLVCQYKSSMGFLAKRFFYLSLLFILYPGEHYVLARQINYKKKLHDAIFGFSLTSIDVTMWCLLIVLLQSKIF